MKHIFIVNPAAGNGNLYTKLVSEIKEACTNPIVYKTKGVGDAQLIASQMAGDLDGEEAVVFACGGDGTANEVLNGIYGHKNIALGIIPIGTGNDTVRNFNIPREIFLNVDAQVSGTLKPIDILQYEGIINGINQSRYCINMFNNGFDCNVVEAAAELKSHPLVSGPMAYYLAIAKLFAVKRGISLAIQADGKMLSEGNILLCALANGSYCGGGIKASPQSSVDDGLMDITIIRQTSRRRFLKLFPSFSKGKHLQRSDVSDLISTITCKEARLLPFEGDEFTFCADGEIAHTKGLEIKVLHKGINFMVPSLGF